jgi:hypothetical protein
MNSKVFWWALPFKSRSPRTSPDPQDSLPTALPTALLIVWIVVGIVFLGLAIPAGLALPTLGVLSGIIGLIVLFTGIARWRYERLVRPPR